MIKTTDISGACLRVAAHLHNNLECRQLEKQLSDPIQCFDERTVPRTIHMVSANAKHSLHIPSTYKVNIHNDSSARLYIQRNCGEVAMNAYDCLLPPAFRADLFRFCALWSEGGLYLDADIFPTTHLDDLYSPCADVSYGIDVPQSNMQGAQMKILAGVKGTSVFKCMLDSIQKHVTQRTKPTNALMVSGPLLLHKCISAAPGIVKQPFYIDTHAAAWPYSGLRTTTKMLAYEKPNEERHWFKQDALDYDSAFHKNMVYASWCKLRPTYLIPATVWGAWKDDVELPNKALQLRRVWETSNPTYAFPIVRDKSFSHISSSAEWNEAFRNVPLGVMKADLMRYALVYEYGAIWMDLDVEHVQRIDEWLDRTKELAIGIESPIKSVTDERGHLCQWFFAAKPKHPLLKVVMDMAASRLREFSRKSEVERTKDLQHPNFVHYMTGPALFTDAVCAYYRVSPCVNMLHVTSSLPEQVQVFSEEQVRFTLMKHHFASAHWIGYKSWTREKNLISKSSSNPDNENIATPVQRNVQGRPNRALFNKKLQFPLWNGILDDPSVHSLTKKTQLSKRKKMLSSLA